MEIMNLDHWRNVRRSLPTMTKEDLFFKYAESVGQRDKDFLLKEIERLHALNNSKSNYELEFARTAYTKFVELAVENPALYDFVLDTDSNQYWDIVDPNHEVKNRSRLASKFFIPWVAVEVPRSIALEVVYGYGLDLYGNYRKIEPTDPYYYFVYKNELFVAIAERGIKTIEILNGFHPEKMLFLAAGMAPEFRHLGLTLDKDQTAILIDNDPTIDHAKLLQDLPFKDQITYLKENLLTAITRPELKGQDAVIANGIVCYVWDKFPQILAIVKGLLNPGGKFIFEVYPKHWEWARNRDIKGYYLPLFMFDDFEKACANITTTANRLGIKDVHYHPFYDDCKKEIMLLCEVTV